MSTPIRLGCMYCDRGDFDGVDKFPEEWDDIHEVQSLEDAKREVPFDDKTRSALDWETHLGTCPECKAIQG